jgi:hypothetical protein
VQQAVQVAPALRILFWAVLLLQLINGQLVAVVALAGLQQVRADLVVVAVVVPHLHRLMQVLVEQED